MNQYIIANRLAGVGPTLGMRMESLLAFDSRDWAATELDAFIYGIVFGWADEEGDEWDTLSARYGWTSRDITLLEALHHSFKETA